MFDQPNHAIVVSFYFPPMNGPATQHPFWFYRFLPDYGIATTVITSSTYAGENIDESNQLSHPRIRHIPQRKSRQLSRYLHALELKVQNRIGIWDHGFPWALWALHEAADLNKRARITGMVSTSPSIASHWAAYLIKERFPEICWVADFTDPFVGNPFHKRGPLLTGLTERFERLLFREADVLSANTDTVLAMWQERYPAYRGKMTVTWNGYDPEEQIFARPIPADRTGCVLCHAGEVYSNRVPNSLLAGLHRSWTRGLLATGSLAVHFYGGFDWNAVKDRGALNDLLAAGIVQIHNRYAPRIEALQAAEEADYLLLLDVTEPYNTKLQVPSKLFDYIRIGRPILALTPEGSPTEFILARSGIPHILLHPGAPDEKVEASILNLLKLPPSPRPASAWFRENFDAHHIVQPVADLLRSRGHTRQMAAHA